jgi:hypothetical protein
MYRIFLLLSLFVWVTSCVTPPDYPEEPTLSFVGFSKNGMRQGVFAEDSVIMTLSFTDGNGDFGTPGTGIDKNIFITDKRTGEIFREFKAPFVPVEGTANGISGTISVKLYTTCCIFPVSTGIPPCETPAAFPSNELVLDVYIKDRAGNVSNLITTPAITLQCR